MTSPVPSLSRHPLAGLLASALLLTGILAWMVADRVMLLRSGTEIVLPIKPVDPRDLFKGDYARLGYDISLLPDSIAGDIKGTGGGTPVYVTIEKDAAGIWKPVAASRARPATLEPGRMVLQGRTSRWSPLRVTYGLERYYVPEGKGLELERMAATSQIQAIVAVDGKGRAAIKGLVVDGKRVYDEPLL